LIIMAQALSVDERILCLAATGVRNLERSGGAFEAHPRGLQLALSHFVLLGLQRGIATPQHVPELLEWCRRPIRTWGLNLPDLEGPDEPLLYGTAFTELAEAFARAGDTEALLEEEHWIRQVFQACGSAHDLYVRTRRFIIENVTLSHFEWTKTTNDPRFAPVLELLRQAYQEVPSHLMHKGAFQCCKNCGGILEHDGQRWSCEERECRQQPQIHLGRQIKGDQAMTLTRGLRRYIAAPGRLELRLAEKLKDLGVQVELYPTLDKYDLRLTFPDGAIWAVDVKDWGDPFRLGRRVTPIPQTPPWDRAFFVFPDERLEQRSDYLRAFRSVRPDVAPKTSVKFVTAFLADVRKHLKGGGRGA
jgi:REase associating with pPIWI_RE/pPIWI_RE three-gene island domain Y